jgi:hypothetical protein
MQLKLRRLAVVLCLGCRSEHSPDTESSVARTSVDGRPAITVAAVESGVCPTPAVGLRFGLDTVAGLPAKLPVAALRKLCASAHVDSVVYAGFASPALRFDFRGATIWAVQNVPDTDTLVPGLAAESWVGIGDSLRFPDGRLIPRRLGLIRAADSAGFMFLNSGDNTEGADVSLCRMPGLSFFFDTLPSPADTSVRPFAHIRRTDTLSYRRVELQRDTLVLKATRRWCKRVRVT